MATIGQKLKDARSDSGLSVEDVSHATHIPANTIRSIEEDDFSQIASVAYARSFIRNYSQYLEVDVSGEMEALNSGVTIQLEEGEFLGELGQPARKTRRFRFGRRSRPVRREPAKRRGAPFLLNLLLFCLIGAMAVFYFLGFNASTPEEARSEIERGLRKANPFADLEESSIAGAAGNEGLPLRAEPVNPAEPDAPAPGAATGILADGTILPPPLPGGADSGIARAETGPATPGADDRAASPAEVVKPKVEWNIGEAEPAPLASVGAGEPGSLKARETPGLRLENKPKLPSLPTGELEPDEKTPERPADLRPEGTDPPLNLRGASGGGRVSPPGSGEEEGEAPLRAVPVARAR